MKNFYKHTLLAVSIALFTAAVLTSCTQEDQIDLVDLSELVDLESYGIYVAGSEFNEYDVATLWINGEKINLTDASTSSCANSVFVSGNEVYVVGSKASPNKSQKVAKLWKIGTDANPANLVETTLPEASPASAHSVFVSGGDVYITGHTTGGLIVWKNGEATHLTNDSGTYGNCLFVSENAIYIAGYVSQEHQNIATLWKIGTDLNVDLLEVIPLANVDHYSQALSVYVSGSTVYVSGIAEEPGFRNQVAKKWQVDTEHNNSVSTTTLTDGMNHARGNSISVAGNDVYVAIQDGNKAVLWNNGTATNLVNKLDHSSAHAVFVEGSDVYVAGENAANLTLWKNGRAARISLDKGCVPLSLFVAKR